MVRKPRQHGKPRPRGLTAAPSAEDRAAREQRAAVFLDRDGVLIRDTHLLCRIEDVELYPCVPTAVRALAEAGFLLIVVTNQPVIARGLATPDDVDRIHRFISSRLEETSQTRLDDFYCCPHHPQGDLPAYRVDCDCRKPKPGMLLAAARDWNIVLERSFMVGDRVSDIIAGRRAGCRTIQVETGQHEAPPIQSAEAVDWSTAADYTCPDLGMAAEWILAQVEEELVVQASRLPSEQPRRLHHKKRRSVA